MPRLLLSLLFLFSISTSHALTTKNDSNIPNCPSFDCGNGVEIVYPFWVPNPQTNSTSYCGYPEFQVTCDDDSPSFRTISDSYTVTEIDPETHTITLVDTDVLGSRCPRARHNVSFGNKTLLSFADSTIHLVFFFNCTVQGIPEEHHLECFDGKQGSSYAFIEGEDPPWNFSALYGVCRSGTVVSPVLKKEMSNGSLAKNFGDAMKEGFELIWKDSEMKNCITCEKSGGRCGYNNGTTGGGFVFQCFCKDGVHHNGHCNDGKDSKKKARIIGIVVGVFVGLLLLACMGFLCWRHRMKKGRTSSLRTLVRSRSSEASSFGKDLESLQGSYSKAPIFSYKELEEATGGFDAANELGDGGFGVVFKGKLKDGRIVAVKRLYERNYRRVKQFRNEVEILNRLRHRNLVALYGCTSSKESQDLILVYEYIPNGTVADHLHGPRAHEHALTWSVRMTIAIEAADSLAYLHAHHPQIIHRDVKTSNILLDQSFTVKVADFGLSRLFPLDVTHVSTAPQGTPGYVDPEYHQCYQLTDKSDVYSFGVVLVELISSQPAVDITRPRSEINLSNVAVDRIPRGLVGELVDPSLGFDEDPEVRRMVEQVAEVAFRCLQLERDMRPTMVEVRETLKDIAGLGDCTTNGVGRSGGVGNTSDDVCLLKNSSPPLSPKSVAGNWISSRSTTPHTSA